MSHQYMRSSYPIAYPLFFFYYYGSHPDLHSFPTRRSSDLYSLPISHSLNFMPVGESFMHCHFVGVFEIAADRKPQCIKRSEEHTSELQSRQYLVCRLLLEKKKNI